MKTNIYAKWLGCPFHKIIITLSQIAVSETSNQGFDPSDFPVLGSRIRHDSSSGLPPSSGPLSRPGFIGSTYGIEYMLHMYMY